MYNSMRSLSGDFSLGKKDNKVLKNTNSLHLKLSPDNGLTWLNEELCSVEYSFYRGVNVNMDYCIEGPWQFDMSGYTSTTSSIIKHIREYNRVIVLLYSKDTRDSFKKKMILYIESLNLIPEHNDAVKVRILGGFEDININNKGELNEINS